ncbi:hypothetical protein EIN_369380 [Entamoeba invadens IP1]|uniref:Uncharacterized protein n=1 Tax=Entamoeba invadens IP1 TaxID=370355 RepID=A0A0A1UBL3_ENTIV|nr:hypothetical protein EIN_369380 [Entamoeba invadens IP1]ELP92616.1 hypothetical protein EIN_369380 [Entamoeba invadens IP1]|eukprot:XP_004259387.1 hypothetical protein EIN_369380 [Entamoeba invadens IP1]
MNTLMLFTLLLSVALSEDLMLYDDGEFYEGFYVVNPDNLDITCEYTKRSNWVAATMNTEDMVVFTKNGTVSTTVPDKDKDFKSIRFMVRYENDDVKELPLNVKLFNENFDTLYNGNLLNSTAGYTVKIKKNNNQKMTIKLDNFNLDGKLSTIVFTRTGSNKTPVKFFFDQVRLDTRDSQNELYDQSTENAAPSLMFGTLVLATFFFILV